MRATEAEIHNQGKFVNELATRLNNDVQQYPKDEYFDHHCQIQDDIKRLRRELMTLSKMFDYDWRK